jgi:hypothetical protein
MSLKKTRIENTSPIFKIANIGIRNGSQKILLL